MAKNSQDGITGHGISNIRKDDIVAFWDFQESAGNARISKLGHPYELFEGHNRVERTAGGVFGPYAANLQRGDYLISRRGDCAALDIHGPTASLSVVAWIKRQRKIEIQCEAIAGMWDETRSKRQYGLFLDLRIHGGGDNVCGHVSALGGPTPGFPWCMDAALAAGYVTYDQWQCVAFTFDGSLVKAWLNGELQRRPGFNPYAYPDGLFDGGSAGADFTVGGVSRGGEMGNWFVGQIGGLAVYRAALSEIELAELTRLLPNVPDKSPTSPPVPI